MQANITGHAAMVAYNMLLGIIPVALLASFVAGQILSSNAVQASVLTDLREIFPGSTEHTLRTLLDEIQDSTTSTGVLALTREPVACELVLGRVGHRLWSHLRLPFPSLA